VSPDELREWFSDYLDACNRHELTELRSFVAPEVRRAHQPGGADTWVADLADLFTAFPDFQWKRISVIVEGDRVAAHLRAGGTHRGTFHGIAPTGRHVNVAEFGMYRVVNGRITDYAGTAGGAGGAELLAQLV
jgi:predicted ester cyclase